MKDFELTGPNLYIDYIPEPQILDSGEQLILSNLPSPWIIRCEQREQIPNTSQGGTYVIINKSDLCECSIFAGDPVWKIERNIAHLSRYTKGSKSVFYLQYGNNDIPVSRKIIRT